jgi:hypothetical protein
MVETISAKSAFDPARFRDVSPQGGCDDEKIVVDAVVSLLKPKTGAFCLIPIEAMRFYPVEARILNMMAYLTAMKDSDKVDGWYRITSGRSAEFLLQDKDARRRALASLESRGVIEVERQNGKSPYVRITSDAMAAFDLRVRHQRPKRHR